MIIRDETPADLDAIRAVTSSAFADHPHSSGNEAEIVDALRDGRALHLSIVADDGGIVGHIAFSAVGIDDVIEPWYGLGPISVSPHRQGEGIGGLLVREGLNRLRTSGAGGCVLLGDPGYYCRFGFENDPALTFGDIAPPHFQRLVFTGTAPRGSVRFHRSFTS